MSDTNDKSRRSFLASVGTGWAIFTAASVAGLGMCVRFLFPNDTFEPATKFKVGYPGQFAASSEGVVDKRFKTRGIWIVRTLDGFFVLSTVCTHLGCTPNWLEAEKKFKCPCHGSGFRKTGINFEGPAPRPLERYRIVLADDGQIIVDKTKKYQQEKGQWGDPEAFLKV